MAWTKHIIVRKELQKEFHYVYDPYAEPVLKVEPGAVIEVDTHDTIEKVWRTVILVNWFNLYMA